MNFVQTISRMSRAATLDVDVYEEVEADIDATSQAIAAVVLVSIACAMGSALGALLSGRGGVAFFGILVLSPIVSLLGYFFWAFLAYFIGAHLFGGTVDYGQMLRCVGFAYTPRLLGALSFVPCIGWAAVLASWIWSLVAVVIAVRQACDFDTGKAIVTCVTGWLIAVVLSFTLSFAVGIPARFIWRLLTR